MSRLDVARLRPTIDLHWDREILPALKEYVAIPALAPGFDPRWRENGHLDRALEGARRWVTGQQLPGLAAEIVRIDDQSPVLVIDVPGATSEPVLFYSHLDKQPPGEGWSPGLGPWTPVVRGDRLYGRGAADDGYAAFAPFAALAALRREGIPHPRCFFVIETCEESGPYDVMDYVRRLRPRIGTPSLIVILDSGAGDYARCWVTTSLRGGVTGVLDVSSVEQGIHSGDASGVVPSSFRIARLLLDRIEDAETGRIRLEEFHAPVPPGRREELRRTAEILGPDAFASFAWRPGARAVSADPFEQLLNRGWTPQLEVTGAEGLPSFPDAGNVLRPRTALKLSIRIPPGVEAARALAALKACLEHDPPYGARVTYQGDGSAGWDAPAVEPWLEDAIQSSSRACFGQPPAHLSEGGSLPLLNDLGGEFPGAQFLITGVLGPGSNAHGPDESLHLPSARALTGVVASVLAAAVTVPAATPPPARASAPAG